MTRPIKKHLLGISVIYEDHSNQIVYAFVHLICFWWKYLRKKSIN